MSEQKLDWEVLEDRTLEPDKNMCTVNRVERARVPGGWLVRAYSATMSSVESSGAGMALLGGKGVGHGVGVGLGLTFVPDPEHRW
jgi:hypothetical protein